MKNKKYFETLTAAEKFAKENRGNVRTATLPNYNYADIVYIVEY